MIFQNRQEAGILLAEKLRKYQSTEAIVYALPRGGMVVGAEIAKLLTIPLDAAVVKKIGHPYNPEYAICAVSENGDLVCNEEERTVIGEEWLSNAIAYRKEEAILKRQSYSKIKKTIPAEGKIAIIVDDGVATGLTMKAAIKWIKNQKPEKIVIAVPVVSKEIANELEEEADEVVSLDVPKRFLGSVGSYYVNFPQVSDDEVERILSEKYE
ncbi:MAG: phosphoribosyltransferase family protein [Patescibacteria group bacterium]